MSRDSLPRLALALASVVAAWVGERQACAAEPDGAAPRSVEEKFQEGLRAYGAGDHARAIELFEQVYRQRPAPAVLFNIAQSARLLGDCRRAVDHYRRFVATAAPGPDRARAETWLAQLGECAGERPAVAPVAALSPAAEAPPAALPAAVPSAGPPPAPSAVVQARPAAPAPASTGHARTSFAAAALGGVAVALAAAGGVAAWRAADAAEQTSALFRDGGDWTPATAAIERDGKQAQTWSVVFFSTAVVTAAAAVILTLRRP